MKRTSRWHWFFESRPYSQPLSLAAVIFILTVFIAALGFSGALRYLGQVAIGWSMLQGVLWGIIGLVALIAYVMKKWPR